LLLIVASFGLLVNCEVYPLKECDDEPSVNCEVSEVRITPCKGFAKYGYCKFKNGNVAHLEVDIIPNFNSNTLHSQLYWHGFVELPLVGMETDACKTSQCPTKSGEKQTYVYDLTIRYPSATYEVKHVITGANKDTEKCCHLFKIKF